MASSAFKITVDTSGADDEIKRLIDNVITIPIVLETVAQKGRERIAELTPVSGEAGEHTKDLWEVTSNSLPGELSVSIDHPFNEDKARHPRTNRIVNDGEHNLLASLEYGTRSHSILPNKPGGVLVFETNLGDLVFTKYVDHPGTRPHSMMRTTAEELRKDLRDRLGEDIVK